MENLCYYVGATAPVQKTYLPPERRTSFGVRKNTVRLSIGIESPDALIKDLRQALVCVAQESDAA